MLKRLVAVALACFLLLGLSSNALAQQLVINEVDYDQPGIDTAEWLELKNVGTGPVSLAGFSLVFVNGANGSTYNGSPVALPSSVTLPAGGYFVVCANAATVPGCNFDAPGAAGDWMQNGAPDAIALRLNGVDHDVLSYEGNTTGWGEGTGAGADDGVGFTSLSRCPDGVDTSNNGGDFSLRTGTPGAANACSGGGGSIGLCGDPATLISAAQGVGTSTPLTGSTVSLEGVLVGDFQDAPLNGFYLQEEDAQHDGNAATSEGIFVSEGALNVAASVGNLVRVRGTLGEADSVTQLVLTDMLVCPGAPLASTQSLSLPLPSVGFAERLEGMRVSLTQTLTVTGNFELGRFGSLDLSANGRLFVSTHVAAPGGPALLQQGLNARSRIILDDDSNGQNPNPIPYKDASGTRRVGDTLASLEGVVEDRFGALRVHATQAPLFASGNPRPATPPVVVGRLKVVALNVLNYFTTIDSGPDICGPAQNLDCRGADSATEFARQRQKTLNALEALNGDVVGLIEVENNASASVQDLVNGLNDRLGAGTYQFINTGTIGTDAIKLALIYKPAKITPAGAPAVLTSAFDSAFLDDKNRPSLAQTFREVATGERFTVVVNHLKSKGSDCNDVGDPDVGDGQGNCNLTRTDAATVLSEWIATHPTGQVDSDYLLIGDFNAYAKEDPITQLKNAGLVALIEAHLGAAAYSYQFEGESGYLDNALASSTLAAQVSDVAEWHSNSDEPVVLDYNLEFKTDDPFVATDPFRSSDHDAVVVGLSLASSAAVPAGGPLGWLALLAGLGAAGYRALRRRPS
jgi:predicted extracellular nuclease